MRILLFLAFIFSSNIFLYLPYKDFYLDCRSSWKWFGKPDYESLIKYEHETERLIEEGIERTKDGNSIETIFTTYGLLDNNKNYLYFGESFWAMEAVIELDREKLIFKNSIDPKMELPRFNNLKCKLISEKEADELIMKHSIEWGEAREGKNQI